ncbi:unnamed protein product [Chilo suppressalis]|uniref:PPM-type phosphatase domain-containing protein n=1 Tax=Chilo suppressalis TaxID=168631 RepID=A0ABN8B6I1_CHISP|nr:hypothetical protein evm_013362 [Chilo suppressalis]CAH0401973.1 unnamed protein product [Chilo suppressalis]
MSYSNLNLLVNSCLKLDLGIRQKILGNWCKDIIFGYASTYYRSFHSSITPDQAQKDIQAVPPTPQEVTVILRKNEFSKEFTSGSVKSYDSNQLASNIPIEDTRIEGVCKMTSGMLMGVFDGHGGPSCSKVISKRLLNYIAAALLPPDDLRKYLNEDLHQGLVETFNDKVELAEELKVIHTNSFKQYLLDLLEEHNAGNDVGVSLEKAILKLDSDMSNEVIEPFKKNGVVNTKTLSVAMSGAVACVAHIDGPHLYIANVGDCNAVLGTLTEDNEWIAKKITKEHNFENASELERLYSEHPKEETKTIIRRNRLLGDLAPLRSMGDYKFKWSVETISNLLVPLFGPTVIPQYYHTPPYLTAKPDVFYHRLTSKDKFLIIASDGIWDMMTTVQSVKLVGEHMKGKVFFNPLKLPRKNIQLGDINDLLLHRKESLKSKPKDRNAATHLIRHAVGGTEYGVDHSRLAHLLSLPQDVCRMFRDDMTVTVVYFDSEFLRQCPS